MRLLKITAPALLLALTCVFGTTTAKAESLTSLIQSDHPNIVSVEFYAQGSNHAWPGGDSVYIIDDNQVHSYPLSCNSGETICYGAWVKGNASTYWGTGQGGKQGCDDCCYTCSGGETPVRVLR
jgi:hypothetical protein